MSLQNKILIVGASLIFLRLIFPVMHTVDLVIKGGEDCIQWFYPLIKAGYYQDGFRDRYNCSDLNPVSYSADWPRTIAWVVGTLSIGGAGFYVAKNRKL